MEFLIPKRCFDIPYLMPEDVVDLVNWVVFILHQPNFTEDDYYDALPHKPYFDANNTEVARLIEVAYEVLESQYVPGLCFVMSDSLRFYRIRREVCQSHPLDEEFCRHLELDD